MGNHLVYLFIAVLVFTLASGCVQKETAPVDNCADLAPEQVQACCDSKAEEGGIYKQECVGQWEIKDGRCAWNCAEGIPNPAAVYCEKQGFNISIREDAEGNQYGVCVGNGKECDEWQYFRGECEL